MSISTLEDHRVAGALRHARAHLDRLYLWAGYASAACICLILLVTMLQVITRYFGINIAGITSYAGYLMAASTFLGLAHALNRGSHIRIETISKLLGPRRLYLDLLAFGTGGVIACWFAGHACRMVYVSYKLGDISTDLDATQLWMPQSAMAFGAVLFAIAILDNFIALLLTGKHRIQPGNEVL